MSHVAIIGAGVIGLSTAIRVLECGHEATIISEYFPGDKKSIQYTSPWAGALHASYARDDPVMQPIERETLKTLYEMAATDHPASGCFLKITQEDHFVGLESEHSKIDVELDFRRLDTEELIPPANAGYSFTTLTIDTAAYLPYLMSVFLEKGGIIARSKVMHVSQVAQGAYTTTRPDVIMVCTGIGSLSLGGVEDQNIYPVRGQVVLIHAPWIKSIRTVRAEDSISYVIPRSSGVVVLGGTKEAHDWFPFARPETTDLIISRALAMFPEIAPPDSRTNGQIPTVEDVKKIVLEVGCGLRPARKGGMRLDVGSVKWTTNGSTKSTPLVFNYGHGGGGYEASWGSATETIRLLNKLLGYQ